MCAGASSVRLMSTLLLDADPVRVYVQSNALASKCRSCICPRVCRCWPFGLLMRLLACWRFV
jgi:hypothetical protein